MITPVKIDLGLAGRMLAGLPGQARVSYVQDRFEAMLMIECENGMRLARRYRCGGPPQSGTSPWVNCLEFGHGKKFSFEETKNGLELRFGRCLRVPMGGFRPSPAFAKPQNRLPSWKAMRACIRAAELIAVRDSGLVTGVGPHAAFMLSSQAGPGQGKGSIMLVEADLFAAISTVDEFQYFGITHDGLELKGEDWRFFLPRARRSHSLDPSILADVCRTDCVQVRLSGMLMQKVSRLCKKSISGMIAVAPQRFFLWKDDKYGGGCGHDFPLVQPAGKAVSWRGNVGQLSEVAVVLNPFGGEVCCYFPTGPIAPAGVCAGRDWFWIF